MRIHRFRHLPVIDNDRPLVGLISHRDLLRGHTNALEAIECGADEALLLRCAALDWHRAPLVAEASAQERADFIAWGAPKRLLVVH